MADKQLTRAAIEKIVNGLNARDIFDAMPQDATDVKGAQVAAAAFDAAAARQGHGEKALDRVSAADATWLSGLLAESLNVGGPKADSTGESPASAATGDSAQS